MELYCEQCEHTFDGDEMDTGELSSEEGTCCPFCQETLQIVTE